MAGHDNRIEMTIMGTLGIGMVLAFTYAFWLSDSGTTMIAGDGSQATRPQQHTGLVAEKAPPAAPVVTDSPQAETATPSEPASSETSQAEPASAPEPLFIAGTTPWERPPAAPFLVPEPKDASWYKNALTGIAPPYPASLSFLEDQGAWYTPFNHPGMTAPYDIRHWHGP